MNAERRDLGLVQAIGPVALGASIVSMVVGAGIFVAPARLGAALGSLAPLAVLACALAVGAIAVCAAEAGSRVPSSGGLYAVIEAAFGPGAGYVGGMLFWVSNVLACAAVCSALGDAAAALVPSALRTATRAAVIVGVAGAVCTINIGGVSRGMRLVSVTTLVKLVPLAVFIIVGAFGVSARNYTHPPLELPDVGQALLVTLFTFQGFETGLCTSGEVASPARAIPRALMIALGTVTLLYAAIQAVAQGLLGPALGHSSVPLADAMGALHPALRLLMLAGAAVSMLGWIATDLMCSPRILFAFARDGVMPAVLGRLSARGHAPYVSILCYAALAVALALSGTFAELAAPATLLMAALYIATCLAAWRLARRGIALAGAPLQFRWLGAAVVFGSASMLALIVLGTWPQILGLAGLIVLSACLYLVQSRLAGRGGLSRQGA